MKEEILRNYPFKEMKEEIQKKYPNINTLNPLVRVLATARGRQTEHTISWRREAPIAPDLFSLSYITLDYDGKTYLKRFGTLK